MVAKGAQGTTKSNCYGDEMAWTQTFNYIRVDICICGPPNAAGLQLSSASSSMANRNSNPGATGS